MDLQAIVLVVAALSPAVMVGVAWGTFRTRLHLLEARTRRLEAKVFPAEPPHQAQLL